MKKTLLYFVFLCSFSTAFAQNFIAGGINYTITSTTAPLTVAISYNTNSSGALVLPETVTNSATSITYTVTSIGANAFPNSTNLTSVIIPNSVTSIGEGAFSECSNLTSVTIGNSVTSIGDRAFYYCTNLTSAIIPNAVTSMGNFTFMGCSSLISLSIGNGVTYIGEGAFYGCSLTSVTIPNNVTSIRSGAFYGCAALTTVTIPNSVTSIGQSAFYSCTGLTSLTIGTGVTSIGNSAFANCPSLTSVTCLVPNPLAINANVFGGTTNQANCDLKVRSSLSAYSTASVWSNFQTIIDLCSPLATGPSAAAQSFFGSPTLANLFPAPSTTFKWYTTATGGTALANSTVLTSGNYYVSQTVNSCESERTAVAVTVSTTTAPVQTFCGSATVADLQSVGNVQWFTSATGGTALSNSNALSTGTYYVERTIPLSVENLGSGFSNPFGVAVESNGKILIADTGNNAIKRMNADGTNISTVNNSFSNPTGVAVRSNNFIYIADFGNNAIKFMRPDGSYLILLNGANQPRGVAVKPDGEIIYTETGSSKVMRMSATGYGATELGANNFSSPFSIAIQPDGKILVADTGNNAIKRMNADGTGVTTLVSGLNEPRGVAVKSDGTIYFTDTNNNLIKRMNADGSNVVNVGSAINSPTGITVQTDGKIVVANFSSNKIIRITEAYKLSRVAVSVTINPTPSAPTANAQSFCGSATVAELTATGTNLKWYSSLTGGSSLLSSTNLSSGAYYVSQTINSCESIRKPVSIIVNTIPTITSTVVQTGICNSSISAVTLSGGLSGVRYIRIKQNLTAAQDGSLHLAELKAYEIFTAAEVAQGKTATASGAHYLNSSTYQPSNITDGNSNTIYHSALKGDTEWVEVDLGAAYNLDFINVFRRNDCNNCILLHRDLQLIFKNEAGIEIHSNKIDISPAPAFITYNVLDVAWTDAATTLNRTELNDGTYTLNYSDVQGCTATHSKTVVGTKPNAPTALAQTFCAGATVANLVATGTAIKWYSALTGGTALATSTALTTKTYYASQTLNACESVRTAVSVIANPIATITSMVGQNGFCNSSISAVNLSGGLSGVRYIRIKQNLTAAQDGSLHLAELQAYEIFTAAEVAQGKTVTASGAHYLNSPTYHPSKITDGNLNSFYHSALAGDTEWIEVDLGAAYNLDFIKIFRRNDSNFERHRDLQLIFKNYAGSEIHSKKIDISGASSSITCNVLDVAWADGATTINRTGLNDGTYTLNYSDVLGCTATHTKTVVGAKPNAPTASAQTFCSGSTVGDLAATGTAIKWYSALTSGTALATSIVLTSGNYYVSQTLNSCESVRTAITVTVNTTTAPTASAQTLCSGATVANLVATGTNLKWYAALTGGTALVSTTALATGTYYVSQTVNGCESIRRPVYVTINPVPAITLSNVPSQICSNEIIPLTTTLNTSNFIIFKENFNQATDLWTTVNSSTGGTPANAAWTLRQSPYDAGYGVTLNSPTTTQIYVANSGAQGNGASTDVSLLSPEFSTLGLSEVSLTFQHFYRHYNNSLAKVEYSINGGSTWSSLIQFNADTNAFITSSANLPVAALNQPAVQIRFQYNAPWAYYWAIDQVTISGKLNSPAVTWSPATNLYTNAAATTPYTLGTHAATVYTKSAMAGSSTYTATASSSATCSTSANVTLNVIATGAPTASAQTFCIGSTVGDLAATGTAIKWYAALTGGTAIVSTTALATGTYYVSQTLNACESERTAVSVTVNTTTSPTPSAQTFCIGSSVGDLAATGTAIKWYAALTGGTALATSTVLTTGNYYVSQTVGGCESSRKIVSITILSYVAPTAYNQSFCGSATVANLEPTGNNYKWYNVATGGTALTNSTALSTQTYYVTQTVNGCESLRKAVNITIGQMPTTVTAYINPTSGPPNSLIEGLFTFSEKPTGIVYNWQKEINSVWSDNTIESYSSFYSESSLIGTITNYRLKITCATSGEVMYSNVVSFTILDCYVFNGGANLGIWKGTTNTDWHTASNWCNNTVPTAASDVIIKNSINQPLINTSTTVKSVKIESGAQLNIAETFTVTENIINNGQLIFKSTSTKTGQLGVFNGTISGSGTATVERYIPAKRAWRALTAPLKGNNGTIFAQWQNNGFQIPNVGAEIWGPSGTGMATGPNYSLLEYTPTGYVNITNTQTKNLFDTNKNNAYLMFVTGGYGSGNIASTQAPTATTLKATGQLITGDVTYNGISNTKHKLIGNPYASALNPATVLNTTTNLIQKFWLWDSNLGSSGGYVMYDKTAQTYNNTTGSYPTGTTAVQSSQAFFVRATTGNTGSITLTENNKSSAVTNAVFSTDKPEIFRLGMYRQEAETWMPLDGAIAVMYPNANPEVDDNDGRKFVNSSENIAFRRNNTSLSSEHRLPLAVNDTLLVKIWNTTPNLYKLKLNTEQFTTTGLTATLQDLYTNENTVLNLDGTLNDYLFNVTTDETSTNERFRIVFQTQGNLSITNTIKNKLIIAPNPVTNQIVTVYFQNNEVQNLKYTLNNALGQLIIKGNLNKNHTIDVGLVASGVYVLQLQNDANEIYISKLIIK